MSQTQVAYLFIPLIPCRTGGQEKVVLPQPRVSIDPRDSDMYMAYLRGLVPKIADNCNQPTIPELYYTGNLCHRVYGVVVKISQSGTSTPYLHLKGTDVMYVPSTNVVNVILSGVPQNVRIYDGIQGQIRELLVDQNRIQIHDNRFENIVKNYIISRRIYYIE